MISIDYLQALSARGVRLSSREGRLQYEAPREVMTPELLAELKAHKAELVQLLEQLAATSGSAPLSYAQKSLWSLHQVNPDSAAYNVTYAAALAPGVQPALLARCVDVLVARHPILRTRYAVEGGEPCQLVSTDAAARLQVVQVFGADESALHDWIDDAANRPFDLAVSPIRLTLLVNADAPAGTPGLVLLLNVHHIAADFWSLQILVRELQALHDRALRGQPLELPPLRLQYRDWVRHEAGRLQGAEGEALAAHWQRVLAGPLPVIDLVHDRLRPPVKTEHGRVHTAALGDALSDRVRAAARRLRVTPYMLLLGVYQLWLHLHTGLARLPIGAPTAGRTMPGSEDILGHFVNAVVLPCEIDPADSFASLLQRTRGLVLAAIDHQDYPFPLLVERLRPPRDTSRSPLFQVLYNWNQLRAESADAAAAERPAPLFGRTLAASSTGTRGATHDLTLNILDDGRAYAAAWTYNTDLFDAGLVAHYALQFNALVAQALDDPERAITRFALLPATGAAQDDEVSDLLADLRVPRPGHRVLVPAGVPLALLQAVAGGADAIDEATRAQLPTLADLAGHGDQGAPHAWQRLRDAALPGVSVTWVLPAGLIATALQALAGAHAPAAACIVAYGPRPPAAMPGATGPALAYVPWPEDAVDPDPVVLVHHSCGWRVRGHHACASPADGRLLAVGQVGRLQPRGLPVWQGPQHLIIRNPSGRALPLRDEVLPLDVIERVLASAPGVSDVHVALASPTPQGAPLVTAWCALDATASAGEGEAAGAALRRHLKAMLSEALQPQTLVLLHALPLRADGQLDTALLPPPSPPAVARHAPEGAVEAGLLRLWREVLGRDDIGVADNFFELGGDSILAAVIVSRAALEGWYLQPRDLFENPTVQALAPAVSLQPRLQAPQGEVTGEVAPGPATAWFLDRVTVDRGHFNQALLLGLRMAPEPAHLAAALRLLARQHDVLRSHFVQREDGWRQVFEPADAGRWGEPDWAVVDCSAPGASDAAVAAAQQGLDLERGPLWRVRWLAGARLHDSRLLIVVHHALVDGVSWGVLLQDLALAHAQLAAGTVPALPLKTTSVPAWVAAWQARLQGPVLDADRAWWRLHAARAAALPSPPQAAVPPAEGPRVGLHATTLDEATTAAVRTQAHSAYATDANDLLLASLHAALQRTGMTGAGVVDVEGHGRDALQEVADLSRSVGWFTALSPVLLEAQDPDDPAGLIKSVKQALRDVPARGASHGPLRYLAAPGDPLAAVLRELPPAPVLFTYLGVLDQMVAGSPLFDGRIEPAAGARSARQPPTHALDVCAYVAGGLLRLECRHDRAVVTDAQAAALLDDMAQSLRALVVHCLSPQAGGLTPSDAPALGLDQAALDRLLDEVAALDA